MANASVLPLSRRSFLSLAGAFAAAPGWAATKFGAPGLKLGVISDIHIYGTRTFPYRAKPDRHALGETGAFEKALRYFDAVGVDGVLLAGDLTENGVDTQLQLVGDVWDKVFPGGKGFDGRPVEKLFIYGNHDATQGLIFNKPLLAQFRQRLKTDEAYEAYRRDHGILPREKEVWERIFREPWSPLIHKTLKGVHFFLANWGHEEASIGALKAELAKIGTEKPFFYVQHRMVRGTCWGGADAIDPDKGALKRLFGAYPNAIVVTGHNHYPLTDERSVWQEEFTALGASTLAYASAMYGRENTGPKKGRGGREKQMPIMWRTSECKQGMVLSLYPERMVLERRDFWSDCAVGDDWIVPLPAKPGGTMSQGVRRRTMRAPAFAPDAAVTVAAAEGHERESGRKVRQLTVTFPAAQETRASRAYDYVVRVEADGAAAPVPEKAVVSTVFHVPVHVARAKQEMQSCAFALQELPATGRFRFAVCAADSFGNRSAPILSDWTELKSWRNV